MIFAAAGKGTGTATTRLLLEVLHGIESVKETQKEHGKILNRLMKAGSAASSSVELPESVKIPLASDEDVALLEEQLKDATTLKCLLKLYNFSLLMSACLAFDALLIFKFYSFT